MNDKKPEFNVQHQGFLSVAVREDKNTASARKGIATSANIVVLLEGSDTDEWWKIKVLPNGPEGFMQKKFLVLRVKPTPPIEIDEDSFMHDVALFSRVSGANSILLITIARLASAIRNDTDTTTGRTGPFRFDDRTWKSLVKKHPETGISEDMIDDWRNQVAIAAIAYSHFAAELEGKLNAPATPFQLYVAFVLGVGATVILFKSPDSTETVEQAWQTASMTQVAIDRVVELAPSETERGKKTVKDLLSDLAEALKAGLKQTHEHLHIDAIANDLGALSRQYESGGDPAARGRDNTGGFSYGLYQLASNKGSVGDFIKFLSDDSAMSEFASALNSAGGEGAAKAGSEEFWNVWKEAAGTEGFNVAQHSFIKNKYYEPCARQLSGKGIVPGVDNRSKALRDVVWSVSVQHGVNGGINLFSNALQTVDAEGRNDDQEVIEHLYRERRILNKYFKSVSADMHTSLINRFNKEENDAKAILAAEMA